MAANEFPYLYPGTKGEAAQQHEEALWERSFRENVCCARAIEKAVHQSMDDDYHSAPDCAAQVLEEYGHKRVGFVLAHTVRELEDVPVVRQEIDGDTREWAHSLHAVPDTVYGRYYCVDTATALLNEFIAQAREAYQALCLFAREHCSEGMYDGNVEGKGLVLSPDALKENAWSQEHQLWLATGGFGCDPKASGRAIYATCLGNGEETRWNREDFVGVLDEQYLPAWAQEKLESLRASEQAQTAAAVMGGMEMG